MEVTKRGSSVVLEGLLKVSNKQNILFKEHRQLNHVDTALKIKGKNLQLYREIRKGLGKE
jgi:uncharacterized beta-barrel protein YwiB (DUF1934 family)